MDYETKAVLRRSINEFLSSTNCGQDEMIYNVREKLKQHKNGLNSIGFGFADNYVRAAEIFLRIFEPKNAQYV